MKMERFLIALLTASLTACGGGSPFATDTTDPGSTDVKIALVASSPTLGSSAVQSITLTATVTDLNNVVKQDQDVIFSSTDGLLTQSAASTDATGTVTATLSSGTDQSIRTIRVTATAGVAEAVLDIPITGTVITIDGDSSVSAGGTVSLSITAKDSDGNGIPNAALTVQSANGNTLTADSITTNANGQQAVGVTATAAGTDTITVSGLGTSATFSLSVPSDSFSVSIPNSINVGACATVRATWVANSAPQSGQTVNFHTTRGTFYTNAACTTSTTDPAIKTTDASGIATVYLKSDSAGPVTVNAWADGGSPAGSDSAKFGAVTPAKLVLSADATTILRNSSSTITAIVRDASDNLVEGAGVVFSVVQDKGGSLTPGSVTSDSLGRASTTYTAADATTATNGVQIRASVVGTSLTEDIYLTVGGQGLGLSIGMATTLQTENENSLYVWYGTLKVVDSNNAPVANQPVSLRVRPISYDRGVRVYSGSSWVAVSSISHFYILGANPKQSKPCMNEDVNENGIRDEDEKDLDRIPIEDFDADGILDFVNEDVDGDGNLDVDEDLNNDGVWDANEIDYDGDGNMDVDEDTDNDGLLDVWTEDWDGDGDVVADSTEDTNGNGLQDEDYNVNRRLDPGTVLSISGDAETNEFGEVVFALRYQKDYANWVDVEITATAQVVGSDSSISSAFELIPTADDVKDIAKAPPGAISPFGNGDSCLDPY